MNEQISVVSDENVDSTSIDFIVSCGCISVSVEVVFDDRLEINLLCVLLPC